MGTRHQNGVLVVVAALAAQCAGVPASEGVPNVCASQDAARYVLPYPVGQAYLCSQGFTGNRGHTGSFRFAADFDMPIGTVVTAARAGQVEFVEDGNSDQDRDIGATNLVVVSHGDGTFARYCHLTKGGALVRVGDQVSAGDRIGLSGMSGSGLPLPHLHFDVTTQCPQVTCQTAPFCFRNAIPHPNGPRAGATYAALPYP